MMYFYADPQVERLVGFVERYDSAATEANLGAYPALAGFLAAVFRAYPDKIERLVPAQLTPRSASAIAAALRLSGNEAAVEKFKARLTQAGFDSRLQAEFAGLPAKIEDLRIQSGGHLDLLWGATFATGSDRYANMILDFFAKTANRSEPIAIDLAKTILSHFGGPKDILPQLRGKYGDPLTIEIIVASSAGWALISNSRQHPVVQSAVTAYMQSNPSSLATKVLSSFQPKRPQ
jgi:hypothetical protein